MANIQLYTQPKEDYYSEQQLSELDKPLDPRLVKTRKEGWRALQYIEGHTAIDQANRIFGYGNWGWRVLECELENIIDPVSGEGVGAIYHSRVEVWIRGMEGTIIDVGSQPVAVSSVEEQIISRRIADAEKAKRPVDESPFSLLEKKNARAVIVQAHEQARKGAGTDGLKRGLRGLGNQFANGLYGDGQVDVSTPPPDGKTVDAGNKQAAQQPKQLPTRPSGPLAKPEQITNIRALIAEAKPHEKASLEELYLLIIKKQYPGDDALLVGEWARLYREVAPKQQAAS